MSASQTKLSRLAEQFSAATAEERAVILDALDDIAESLSGADAYWAILQCIEIQSEVPVEELDEEVEKEFGTDLEDKLEGLLIWIETGEPRPDFSALIALNLH